MAEELQHLIERIRTDAVEQGEKQAAQILAQAREKAAAEVREAEAKARALLEKAEKDAQVFTDRSIHTLAQASRDLLITVGQGVENILSDLAGQAAAEALKPDIVEQMIVKMAEAYVARGGRDHRIELLVGEQDQARLVRYFKEKYHSELTKGLVIHTDPRISKGFKVSFTDRKLYHDFTKEAIAEALANFLRPHLAEIVLRAAREGHAKTRGGSPA